MPLETEIVTELTEDGQQGTIGKQRERSFCIALDAAIVCGVVE